MIMSSGGLCIAVFSYKNSFFPSDLTKTNVGIATCLPFGECDNYVGP